jgi:transcription-repair coupling factor (superfamily II helicase)
MIDKLLSSAKESGVMKNVRLRGADESSTGWWLANAVSRAGGPLVFLETDPRRLRNIESNLRFFLGLLGEGAPAFVFPAWDIYPYARISPSSEVVGERMAALDFLLSGGPGIVLTTPEAVGTRIPPPRRLGESALTLREGEEIDRDRFLGDLEARMYLRRSIVESPGEYAVRGGIVDIYSPQERRPIRLDFRGDEIDALREFHPQTQRTLQSRSEVRVFPARELILTEAELESGAARLRAQAEPGGRIERLLDLLEAEGQFSGMESLAPIFLTEMGTFFDAVPGDALWLIHEPDLVEAAMKGLWSDVEEEAAHAAERGLIGYPPERMWLRPAEVEEGIAFWPRVGLDPLGLAEPYAGDAPPAEGAVGEREGDAEEDAGDEGALIAERLMPVRGRLDKFLAQLEGWLAGGERVVIVAGEKTQALRVQALLREREFSVPILPPAQSLEEGGDALVLAEGLLTSSIRLIQDKRVFFRADDLLATSQGRGPSRAGKGRATESLRDLKAGDYLVHIDHGVGRYLGVRILDHAEGQDEFLHITYAEGDKLYVPMDDIDRVHIFRGAGEAPALSRLGGTSWVKTKRGVKKALQSIARDLVRLYSERKVVEGYAFGQEGAWDSEVAAGFEYEETKDQERAILDVLADMEKPKPMDRLVCGDVGYGKTEVALRAAARAISAGKQVAIVVPTTLLAHQHFQTFTERMATLPARVEMLSRFRTRKEQAETIEGLTAGDVDIVIGTHRLLQKDVAFKDLGLLIVDEEHRFGVVHKEKFKKMRVNVDVLTLTATPIPRTLQLALSGARDLSTIETPPRHRLAPRTYISRFSKKVVAEAIRREMDRGGQVFFVHNRVHSLPAMTRFVQAAVPEARLLVAHGQMRERELEKVMEDFVSRKGDVLLCTSIIESGLDIPTVNTILISRADTFGMAQLYQLRGRVGRDRFQAHAYLLVPGKEALTREARGRLQALEELSELGSGFKLAARDLEIRGAGHLLGHRQSGRIASVGFEMYCRLLEEVIQEARGQSVEYREPDISVPVAGAVPPAWIPSQEERLEVYRRIAAVASPREIGEIEAELADRFGELPPRAKRLLQLGELRIRCRRCGIKSFHMKGKLVFLDTFPGDYELSAAFLATPGMVFTGTHSFQLTIKGNWEEDFGRLTKLLEMFEACAGEREEEGEENGGAAAGPLVSSLSDQGESV